MYHNIQAGLDQAVHDTGWPYQGGLEAYVDALGSIYLPQIKHSKMISVEACWVVAPGTGLSFSDPESAKDHPIARALFGINGVLSVWILGDEVQVCKDETARWGTLNSRIIETIKQTAPDN